MNVGALAFATTRSSERERVAGYLLRLSVFIRLNETTCG